MTTFFWLDMEMTGLNPDTDRILEAAAIVTDADFTELEVYETAVFQDPEILKKMDEWCQTTHSRSGLLERVKTGASEASLDSALTALAKKHGFDAKNRVILCGNSIGQDRSFVHRYLPEFSKLLHYRLLDVSSFKIVFDSVYGKKYDKSNKHQALDDIRESIAELKYFLGFLDEKKLKS